MKFSGYAQETDLARLFHAWLDCFALLKLGAVGVCASCYTLKVGFCEYMFYEAIWLSTFLKLAEVSQIIYWVGKILYS